MPWQRGYISHTKDFFIVAQHAQCISAPREHSCCLPMSFTQLTIVAPVFCGKAHVWKINIVLTSAISTPHFSVPFWCLAFRMTETKEKPQQLTPFSFPKQSGGTSNLVFSSATNAHAQELRRDKHEGTTLSGLHQHTAIINTVGLLLLAVGSASIPYMSGVETMVCHLLRESDSMGEACDSPRRCHFYRIIEGFQKTKTHQAEQLHSKLPGDGCSVLSSGLISIFLRWLCCSALLEITILTPKRKILNLPTTVSKDEVCEARGLFMKRTRLLILLHYCK